jgi:hypothetical protein
MHPLREDLENSLLVTGKEITRYHADSESEDEEPNEDWQYEKYDFGEKAKLPIAVHDEELTPRDVMCENCKEVFDVTDNETRDCRWHPGSSSPPETSITCSNEIQAKKNRTMMH